MRVYMDHAATTPLDERVFEAMVPYWKEHFGNASSVHALGRRARVAVEESRARIAHHLGADPSEIIFTSGGSEADNTALKGLRTRDRRGLITSMTEHEAVLHPAKHLAEKERPVTILPPDEHGAVSPEKVADAITSETGLVSLMHANNEVGTLTPLAEISSICREKGVLLHSDAVQTAGLFRLKVDELGVDALSASAHKFYGPKGIGFLYIRGGTPYEALVEGGAQERKRRAGTENVASIVGMAKALDLTMEESVDRTAHLFSLRDRLYHQLREALGELFVLNTPLEEGMAAPHVLNIAFPPQDDQPIDGEMLLLNLDMEGICVSSGSACTSGAIEPSHVLLALGRPRETAAAAIRFSLGKSNTEEEVDYTVEKVAKVVQRMSLVL